MQRFRNPVQAEPDNLIAHLSASFVYSVSIGSPSNPKEEGSTYCYIAAAGVSAAPLSHSEVNDHAENAVRKGVKPQQHLVSIYQVELASKGDIF